MAFEVLFLFPWPLGEPPGTNGTVDGVKVGIGVEVGGKLGVTVGVEVSVWIRDVVTERLSVVDFVPICESVPTVAKEVFVLAVVAVSVPAFVCVAVPGLGFTVAAVTFGGGIFGLGFLISLSLGLFNPLFSAIIRLK